MKKEKGSITLEAAIFLSMFLIAYLAFMDLVQVARAQMILQYTLDETTKELAQNSYIPVSYTHLVVTAILSSFDICRWVIFLSSINCFKRSPKVILVPLLMS